jgi:beta-lactam-binding protein with PASTA domain
MTSAAASKELREAKLGAAVVDVGSLEPADTVIAQSVASGATVNQGTVVSIEVSTGQPPTGVVPNVLGQTFDEALANLQAYSEEERLELTFVTQQREVEDSSQVGRVVALGPGPGSQVGWKATIVVVVGIPAPGG